jgi:5-methylcytosine-specific restriction endonuclease McrA
MMSEYDAKRWSPEIVLAVWRKGKIVSGYDENTHRKDACGAWMEFRSHGDRDARYGWEIDHIKPVSEGGTDSLDNLRPLHWENNVAKGESSVLLCAIHN